MPYVYYLGANAIAMVELAEHNIVKTVPIAGTLNDVACGNGKVFVSTDAGIKVFNSDLALIETVGDVSIAYGALAVDTSDGYLAAILLHGYEVDIFDPVNYPAVNIPNIRLQAGEHPQIAFDKSSNKFVVPTIGSDGTNTLTTFEPTEPESIFIINRAVDGVSAGEGCVKMIDDGDGGDECETYGNRLYVSNYDSGTVTVFDTDNDTVVGTIPVGTNPTYLALDAARGLLYVDVSTSIRELVVIDTATNGELNRITIPFPYTSSFRRPMVNKATGKVYVSDGDGKMVVIDPDTHDIIGDPIVVAEGGSGKIAVNEATNTIYYLGERAVSVINGDTGTVTDTIDCPTSYGTLNDIAVNSAAGKLILGTDQGLIEVNIDDRNATTGLISGPVNAVFVDPISGKTIVVVENDAYAITYKDGNEFLDSKSLTPGLHEQIAADGSGGVYISSYGGDTVDHWDVGGNISNINTADSYPFGVAAGTVCLDKPDEGECETYGNRIYVSNFNAKSVTVIDADTNSIVGEIQLKSNATYMSLDNVRGLLYVDDVDGVIQVISTSTNEIVAPITNPEGTHVLVSSVLNVVTGKVYADEGPSSSNDDERQDWIAVIDPKTHSIKKHIPLIIPSPENPKPETRDGFHLRLTVDEATNKIYALSNIGPLYEPAYLFVIDGETDTVIKTVDLNAYGAIYQINDITVMDNMVYVATDNGIVVLDADMNDIETLIQDTVVESLTADPKDNYLGVVTVVRNEEGSETSEFHILDVTDDGADVFHAPIDPYPEKRQMVYDKNTGKFIVVTKNDGGGISMVSPEDGSVTTIPLSDSHPGVAAGKVCLDGDGDGVKPTLTATITADPETAAPGEEITYTATLTNTTQVDAPVVPAEDAEILPGTVTDVTIRDIIPDGLMLVKDSVTVDGGYAADDTLDGEDVILAALAPGDSVTVKFNALVDSDADGTIANTATFEYYSHETGTPKKGSITSSSSDVVVEGGDDGDECETYGNRIYVSNFRTKSVTVIDADTNSIVGEIKLNRTPSRIALDSVQGLLYVNEGDETGSDLQVISTATNKIVETITNPEDDRGFVSSVVNEVTGKVYVDEGSSPSENNAQQAWITVIDPKTHTIKHIQLPIPSPENPPPETRDIDYCLRLAMDEASNKIYALYNTGPVDEPAYLFVIDGATDTVINTVDLSTYGTMNEINWITVMNNMVYVATDNGIVVLDADMNDIETLIQGTAVYNLAADPEDGLLGVVTEVINDDGSTTFDFRILDVTSGDEVAQAAITPHHRGQIVFDKNTGKFIMAIRNDGGGISMVSPEDGSVSTITLSYTPPGVAAGKVCIDKPDEGECETYGDRLYVSNYDSGTVTVFGAARNIVKTIDVGDAPTYLALDAARGRLYVNTNAREELDIIDTATNESIGGISNPTQDEFGRPTVDKTTGKVYVRVADGKMAVIDPEIHDITDADIIDVATGGSGRIAVDEATNTIYYLGERAVSVINGDTDTVDDTIDWLDPYMTLHDIAVDTATGKLLIASGAGLIEINLSDSIARLGDLKGFPVREVFVDPISGKTIAVEGDTAYAITYYGDGSTTTDRADLTVGQHHQIASDDSGVYIPAYGGTTVNSWGDTSDPTLKNIVTADDTPWGVAAGKVCLDLPDGIGPEPTLTATKTANKATAKAGDEITYTATLMNTTQLGTRAADGEDETSNIIGERHSDADVEYIGVINDEGENTGFSTMHIPLPVTGENSQDFIYPKGSTSEIEIVTPGVYRISYTLKYDASRTSDDFARIIRIAVTEHSDGKFHFADSIYTIETDSFGDLASGVYSTSFRARLRSGDRIALVAGTLTGNKKPIERLTIEKGTSLSVEHLLGDSIPGEVTDIKIKDILPAELTLVPDSVTVDGTKVPDATLQGNDVIHQGLAPGKSVAVRFRARMGSSVGGTIVANKATFESLSHATGVPTDVTTTTDTARVTVECKNPGKGLYVSDYESGTVSLINADNGNIISTIPVGSNPNYLALDAVRGLLYVVTNTSANLDIIDTVTKAIIKTIANPDSDSFGRPTVDKATGKVYVRDGDGKMAVIDPDTHEIIGTPINVASGGSGKIAVDETTNTIYYLGESAVSVIDGDTDTVDDTIDISPTVGTLNDIAVDSAAGKLLVATSNRLVEISLSDNKEITNHLNSPVDAVFVDPISGKTIAVEGNSATALTFNGDGTVTIADCTLTPGKQHPQIASDGSGVYISSYDGSTVDSWNMFDTTVQNITTADSTPFGVAAGAICLDSQGVTITLLAAKNALGAALVGGEFEFGLYDKQDDLIAEATNDKDGLITFEDIQAETGAEYDWTVKEKDSVADWNADTTIYPVHISVDEDGNVTVDYPDGTPSFKNRTKSETCGLIEFPELTFDEAGRYEFDLKELTKSGNGWITDSTVHRVVVNVVEDDYGNLVATAEYEDGYPHFVNKYGKTASIVLSACKIGIGAALTDDQFTFGVFDLDGEEVTTATNKAAKQTYPDSGENGSRKIPCKTCANAASKRPVQTKAGPAKHYWISGK
jgi:pilin isopeptide linkage protein